MHRHMNLPSLKMQSKIKAQQKYPNQFAPQNHNQNQYPIQQYLQAQNDAKILSFKQSLSMLHDVETIQFQDNTQYYGQILDDLRHGIGIFQTEQGDIYMGDWLNDTYHGYGVYIYHEGERYEGDLVQGMKQGHGNYFYLDGRIYQGMWQADQRDGQGVERDTAKGIYYEGEWQNDNKQGKGKICLLSLSDWDLRNPVSFLLQGTWHNNQFTSGAIQTQVYKGQLNNHTINSQGVYKFTDGSMYQGNFFNNLMHGPGTYYYSNGDVYEGEFLSGLKHGKGVYRYFTGDVYTGGYEKDIKCGEGRFAFVNGNFYVGEFQRDCFHGKGKYFFTKDQALCGWWENGKFVKNDQGDDIGNNRKIALMRQNNLARDRTPRTDRSRSSIARSPIPRSPIDQNPSSNSYINPNPPSTRSLSPFTMNRNGHPRQQKAGTMQINPSRSPIKNTKFMEVHTPADSYFKQVNREYPTAGRKQYSSIKSIPQPKSNKVTTQERESERKSDQRFFQMLKEGEEELERRQINGQGQGQRNGPHTFHGSSQQVKKISKKFQR